MEIISYSQRKVFIKLERSLCYQRYMTHIPFYFFSLIMVSNSNVHITDTIETFFRKVCFSPNNNVFCKH